MITPDPAGIATGRAASSTQGHVATAVAAGLELALSVMPVARPLFGNPRARAVSRQTPRPPASPDRVPRVSGGVVGG